MNVVHAVFRLSVFCALLLSLSTPARAKDADADFNLGVNLYNKQRWELAEETFQTFLQDHPAHARTEFARLYLGLSQNAQQKYEPARRTLQKFVDKNPDSRNLPDALYRIGESSYYLKDYPAAVKTLSTYLADHPQHSFKGWGQLLLGACHNNLKQPEKAVTVLTNLIEKTDVGGFAADGYFELGKAYEALANTDDAIAAYETVVDQKAGLLSARALARLGDLAYSAEQYATAAEYFDQLADEHSDLPLASRALLQSARSERMQRKTNDAIRKAKKIPTDATEWLPAQILIGLSQRDAGKMAEARQTLAEAYKVAGDSDAAADLLFERAELEVRDNQQAAAAQLYTDLADRFPKSPVVDEALFKATDLRIQLSDDAAAVRTMQRLTADFPERASQPDAQLLSGRLLLIQNKTKEAVQVLKSAADSGLLKGREQLLSDYLLIKALYSDQQYQTVLETFAATEKRFLDPAAADFRQAIELAALCHYRQTEYEKAINWATEYLQRETRSERKVTALKVRANSAVRLGDFDMADQDIATLLKDFPQDKDAPALLTRAAEQCYEKNEFQKSAGYFDQIVELSKDNELQAKALSGAAWAFYKQEKLPEAAQRFDRINTDFRGTAVADEAGYMLARIQEKTGNTQQALAGYQSLFESIAERLKTDPEADRRNLGFDAARSAARLAEEANQFQDASQVWSAMRATYSSPERQEQILISMANMHLAAQDYAAAEKQFQELLNQFPNSKEAPQAKFVIAEEQMQRQEFDKALKTFQELANDKQVEKSIQENSLFQACAIQTLKEQWNDVLVLSRTFGQTFPQSVHAAEVQLYLGEALLNQKQLNEADQVLKDLQASVQNNDEAWVDRIWVTRAEVALAAKEYSNIDSLAEQLAGRSPDSAYGWLMDFVQGRRWKTQAPPNFERSRDYLKKVVSHPDARGTESAATAQFLIAETFLMQDNIKQARLEFLRTYATQPYDTWRSRALLQSARCDEELGDKQAALRSYEDFLKEFPTDPNVKKVQQKITELGGGSN